MSNDETGSPQWLAHAVLDPAAAFQTPEDVVAHPGLSTQQRIDVLRAWEYGAAEAEVAEDLSLAQYDGVLTGPRSLGLDSMTLKARPMLDPTHSIRTDWAKRCSVAIHDVPWVNSPAPGVERKMLERDGGELAKATSVVRYAPGSAFKTHSHGLGEEILVLEGVFSDEHGDYGPGTYLRNPPGSSHAPFSRTGCTLFVKLRYHDPRDDQQIVVDTRTAAWRPGLVPGLRVMPLHSFETQHTALVRWAPQTDFSPHRHYGGEEILVLEGTFSDEHGDYPALSWLRSPHLSAHQPFSREGCLILVKVGHLLTA